MRSDPRPLVLIPHQTGGNIYLDELGAAYRRAGWRVAFGSENLMQTDLGADLVHLHWPEEHYRWRGEGAPAQRAERLKEQVQQLSQRGTPIALTVHNLAPHEHFNDPLDRGVYQFLLEQVDLLHHHCPLSLAALARQYELPSKLEQVVVPHGNYLGYPEGLEREAARAWLGIPADDFVFLHFGQMRGYKGMDLLHQAFAMARVENKHLLLAGRYRQEPGWRGRIAHARLRLRHRLHRGHSFQGRDIPNAEVRSFLAAADCLVLGHTAGLNSGVAVLGMSFARPVIGPRIGCIDWLLQQGDNLGYPAGDAAALAARMEEVARAGRSESSRNAAVAASWTWDAIAAAVLGRLAA